MLKKFNQKISEGFLFTDQYELVMAQLYFKENLHEKEVQFDHFFRSYPDYGGHKAGFCINAGLEWLVDWMENSSVTDEDIELLKNHKNEKGKRIFYDDFLKWLKNNGNFSQLNIKAIPEGRVIHPNTPVTIVHGPLAIAQILETSLLNQLNFQILIATKAARIKNMGRGKMFIDFGARRGQDRGAVAGVRAALIGGADFSSNVGISHVLGFPPKGTHAHSLVQLYLSLGATEEDAFQVFADLYPDDCILLVDTINTLESGIPNAIKVFEKLRGKGHNPAGIRLDSGDLAFLSVKAAKMLNDADFPNVKILLSNQLDEMTIWQIISQIIEEAPKEGIDPESVIERLVYGVGTRLITSSGDAALDGVYKLTSVKDNNEWKPAIKISENIDKIPNPGDKNLLRIYDNNDKATADLIALNDENFNEKGDIFLHHPSDQSKFRKLSEKDYSGTEILLKDIYKNGKLVYDFPSIEEIRKIRDKDLDYLDTGVKRLINPHLYHVSLTKNLWNLKNKLIKEMKGKF